MIGLASLADRDSRDLRMARCSCTGTFKIRMLAGGQ